jgi:ABC-type nitrate/sulfonate/bicarbonate transport system substrate-binding protein
VKLLASEILSARRCLLRGALCAVLVLSVNFPVQAQDPRKVRLAYSAFSISFLNLFVARDAGLFKKYGVEPELVQMAGPLPVAALASGEIDYLTGYTTGIADAVSHQWPSR